MAKRLGRSFKNTFISIFFMAFNHKKIIQNGGIMLYYAIEKLKSIKFSQSAEWLLTLLYLVVAVVLVV